MTTRYEVDRLRDEVDELIAWHAAAPDAVDFTRYADDPAGFFRDVLRCEPWAKQIEIAERVRDKPVEKTGVLCVTGNGLGKDWATARIALWWVYARRGFVILTGPTENQVKNILMREIRNAFSVAAVLPGELYALELRVADDCGVLAFTSNNANRMTGFHHPRLLICITEGQGVEDFAYEAALRCCTGAENRLFVYGNPNSAQGNFYDAATNGNWDVLTIAASEHPNVVSGREIIPGSVTRESIARMAREYGDDSPIYSAAVLAQFPMQGSVSSLVRRDWLEAAYQRHERNRRPIDADPLPVFALDVARSLDRDESVAAIVQGTRVLALHAWRSRDLTETADRFLAIADRTVVELVREHPFALPSGSLAMPDPEDADKMATWIQLNRRLPIQLVCDAPSVGGGVIDYCKRIGRTVTEWWGWRPARDEKRFANMRAEAYWNFRTMLEAGALELPQDKALTAEALAMEWSQDTKGRVVMIAKEDLRAKIGRSPDRLDAIVMALYVASGGLRPPMIRFSQMSV